MPAITTDHQKIELLQIQNRCLSERVEELEEKVSFLSDMYKKDLDRKIANWEKNNSI
jgi:hypothetical protein